MLQVPSNAPAAAARPASIGRNDASIAVLRPDVLAVVAAVLAVSRDHADAQDAANETLRRAVEGEARLHDGAALRPWLIGIARHVALDARRARGRMARRAAPDDAEGPSALDRVATARPGPFEQLADARRAARVRAALATLPDGPRQALTLFHIEGLGYEEIVQRLGVPMGTVATWVSRGRKALAIELAAEGTAS